MKTSPWFRWLVAAIAVSALALFAACGDDDDDGNDNNGSNGGGGGDAEDYVATLCGAFGEFGDAFTSILTDPDNQDASEEEALQLFEEPFEDLLNALQDADPPGDIEEFHDALVENFEASVEEIRDGNVEALADVASVELPTPSAEVEAKYSALAEANPDCASASLFE